MTRAIITQLVAALETGWSPQFTGKDARALSDAALTAARKYLATEPSGERAEFEAWCKSVGHSTSLDHADKRRYWYAETSAAWDAWQASRKAKQAYDMLEADASLRTQLALLTVEKDMVIGLLADLLEADAQPKQVTCQIYGHVVGACVECNTHIEAQQAKRVPMAGEEIEKIADGCRAVAGSVWPHAFARAIEAHHGITPADKPTGDEPEDLYALALKADNWGQP